MSENLNIKKISKKMKDALRQGMRDARTIKDPAFESLKGCDRVAVLNPYTFEVVLVLSKTGEFKPKLKSGISYDPDVELFEWEFSNGGYHKLNHNSYYFEVDEIDVYEAKCPPMASKDGNIKYSYDPRY